MATHRRRPSGAWEFVVKRKKLLPRPVFLTFDSEQEGIDYCARLEALLDRGIVPPELVEEQPARLTRLADVIAEYRKTVSISTSDDDQLALIRERHGALGVESITYAWAESWISGMKRVENLAPSTIRHYVGALARCIDWALRKNQALIPGGNPLRLLPKRYAAYTEDDRRALNGDGLDAREDTERDRRLQEGEDEAIREIMGGRKPEGRQRALELRHQPALVAFYVLALESAMRMREMFTLTTDQVDVSRKTVFLDKTKNGDKRQVPLTTVAIAAVNDYLAVRGRKPGLLFPWWDGDAKTMKATTSLLSRQYARIFEAAGCVDLHFHDLRHEATSRLFERTTLTDTQIARITGHRDPRMLKRYANLRGSDLAGRLW